MQKLGGTSRSFCYFSVSSARLWVPSEGNDLAAASSTAPGRVRRKEGEGGDSSAEDVFLADKLPSGQTRKDTHNHVFISSASMGNAHP